MSKTGSTWQIRQLFLISTVSTIRSIYKYLQKSWKETKNYPILKKWSPSNKINRENNQRKWKEALRIHFCTSMKGEETLWKFAIRITMTMKDKGWSRLVITQAMWYSLSKYLMSLKITEFLGSLDSLNKYVIWISHLYDFPDFIEKRIWLYRKNY